MADIAARRPLIGTVLTMPGAVSAELVSEPFDVVWVDLEHGALSRSDAIDLAVGAQATGTTVLARLPTDATALISVVLDGGFDGVVLADVRTAAAAALGVGRLRYPPLGGRGFGVRRSGTRGRSQPGGNREPALWVQIESQDSLGELEAIAATDGVEALVVGTMDLSFSVGTPREPASDAVLAIVERVRRASRDAGRLFGVAGPLDRLPPEVLATADVLMHGTDLRMLTTAVDDAAAWLRSVAGPER